MRSRSQVAIPCMALAEVAGGGAGGEGELLEVVGDEVGDAAGAFDAAADEGGGVAGGAAAALPDATTSP
jgi:hypothetical protein